MALGVALAVAGLALRLGGPQAGPGRRATVHPAAQLVVAGPGSHLGGAEPAVARAAQPVAPQAQLALDLRLAREPEGAYPAP